DQQNKSSGTDQQGKQNTEDDRKPLTLTSCRWDYFGPSGFLRRSYTQPEEKIAHRPINLARNLAKCCTSNPLQEGTLSRVGGLEHVPGFAGRSTWCLACRRGRGPNVARNPDASVSGRALEVPGSGIANGC